MSKHTLRSSTYKVIEADAKGDDGFSSVEIILDLLLNARLGSIQHAWICGHD